MRQSFQRCCQLLTILSGITYGFTIPLPQKESRRVQLSATPGAHRLPRGEEEKEPNYDELNMIDSSPLLLDPYSEEAIEVLRHDLRLSSSQITKVQRLANLVCDWNTRVNLVSRKDCSPSVVFSRHILPCLSCFSIPENSRIMDVGTGGGFPGIVMAIQHDSCEFILLDAIGKKLVAVSDMVQQLQLDNVREVHHGRVEVYKDETVDIVTGRGVSNLRAFMGATQHVLRSSSAQLIYWTGGETGVDEAHWCESSIHLRDIIPSVVDADDDKRILTFSRTAIQSLAVGNEKRRALISSQQQAKKRNHRPKPSKPAKGSWRRRDETEPKQRGYDNFKRYDSSTMVTRNTSE